MRVLNEEISKLNFMLALLTVEFFCSGYMWDSQERHFLSEESARRILIVCMIAVALLGLFLLMRSHVCRSYNLAVSAGIIPAMLLFEIDFLPEYKFQILATLALCILSIVRTYFVTRKITKYNETTKKMLLVRYSILLYGLMSVIAYLFIA